MQGCHDHPFGLIGLHSRGARRSASRKEPIRPAACSGSALWRRAPAPESCHVPPELRGARSIARRLNAEQLGFSNREASARIRHGNRAGISCLHECVPPVSEPCERGEKSGGGGLDGLRAGRARAGRPVTQPAWPSEQRSGRGPRVAWSAASAQLFELDLQASSGAGQLGPLLLRVAEPGGRVLGHAANPRLQGLGQMAERTASAELRPAP
jgi:hypothetical protein